MAIRDELYGGCVETSSSLIAAYRAGIKDAESDHSLGVVHYRGGQTEYELGVRYASSTDPLDRVTGADVLGQLGYLDPTFVSESVVILIGLLSDPDDMVVYAAATALGHRNDPSCVSHVLPLVTHPNPDVRFGAVMALSGHEELSAITGLVALAVDSDRAVRNWATFGLGSLTKADTPELRDVLAKNIQDADCEIRGEALIGLARCRDERAFPAVSSELSGPFHGAWCVEAAELLADSRLLPLLRSLRESLPEDEVARFSSSFDRAEQACQ